ncbi:MAG: cation transporter, partial [Armatimonadota bacterium]|nr:cation transporter [Armatimonadota bacterium]
MDLRQEIVLDVHGMTCDACARHVQQALEAVPGVAFAEVPDWRAGQARVRAAGEVTDALLVQAVQEAGYRAAVRERRSL